MANEIGSAASRRGAIPAMTAHHLAESVRAGHNGASDAVDNLPPADASMLSQTEQTLIARAREHFATLRLPKPAAAIAAPVAWAATLGRSVLAGVSVSIGIVVVAQVSVLAGLGGWMPLASPALWAISSGDGVTSSQLLLVIPYFAACILGTASTWRTMQLDH